MIGTSAEVNLAHTPNVTAIAFPPRPDTDMKINQAGVKEELG
jgi:hypothetical protein